VRLPAHVVPPTIWAVASHTGNGLTAGTDRFHVRLLPRRDQRGHVRRLTVRLAVQGDQHSVAFRQLDAKWHGFDREEARLPQRQVEPQDRKLADLLNDKAGLHCGIRILVEDAGALPQASWDGDLLAASQPLRS